MTRYINWPLAISPAALNLVANALDAASSGHRIVWPPEWVEVKNMANEARAMLQKLPPKPVIDPMLE